MWILVPWSANTISDNKKRRKNLRMCGGTEHAETPSHNSQIRAANMSKAGRQAAAVDRARAPRASERASERSGGRASGEGRARRKDGNAPVRAAKLLIWARGGEEGLTCVVGERRSRRPGPGSWRLFTVLTLGSEQVRCSASAPDEQSYGWLGTVSGATFDRDRTGARGRLWK